MRLRSIVLTALVLTSCSVEPYEPIEDTAELACSDTQYDVTDIAEIVAAYSANEVAAQQEFGGQCVLIAGEVSSIELDWEDRPVVRLSADIIPEPSIRLLPALEQEAASLSKGEQAHFLCSEVSEFLGSPRLDNCAIVEVDRAQG